MKNACQLGTINKIFIQFDNVASQHIIYKQYTINHIQQWHTIFGNCNLGKYYLALSISKYKVLSFTH